MTLKTRKPTGKPPWPITLLAGGEKSGKTYAAALASASDLIGRTFWISIGEDDPDEYGAIEGARFEIVEHDGTYRDILRAVTEASAEPTVDGKPNLIVIDSQGQVWELIKDMAQASANQRNKGRAESQIHSDLWNIAAKRHRAIFDVLRRHQGPSLITARLEMSTVFEDGQPTKQKAHAVKAQKNVVFDVGAIVQMPTFGETYLTGVRSLKVKPEDKVKVDDFTVDKFWRWLGLDGEGATTERVHTRLDPGNGDEDADADAARAELLEVCAAVGRDPGTVNAIYEARYGYGIAREDDPEPIRALIAEIKTPESTG